MSKSSFMGVGAAFLMAFVLLLAYGSSAYAVSPTGSISGTITKDAGGTPVQDAVIFVTDFTTGAVVGNATSSAAGVYSVGSLDAGTYRVQVNATDQGLPVQFYGGVSDADSATTVTVIEHADTPSIDIDLSNGGTISGTVTDGTDPISGAEVWAEVYDCCGAGNGTTTAGDGTFSISGLPAGDYRVIAAAPDQGFSHEFYNNTTDWDSATRVTVTNGGDAVGTDFSLSSGGNITGTVIKDIDSSAVANADVFANSYDGTTGGGGTQTDGSGNYTIVGLPPGDYRVEVFPNDASLSNEFYNDTTDWFQAARVAVSSNATTTLSAISLSSGTSISGRVTDTSTNGILNADVWAELYDCCGGQGTQTDSNGDYTISGLRLGDYRVQVNVPGQSFTTEFYDNTSDWFLASRVTTSASSTISGIDFQLDAGGSISGNVSDGTNPVADAWIWAETYDCCGAGGGAQTDASGNYTISGLAAGNYRVQVNTDSQNLAGQFYNNTTDWSAAAQVAVTANADESGINFVLATGGSITGRVTDGTDPIANVDVWADAYDCCGGGNGAQTDSNGDYTINGLAPGDYRVQVNVFDQNFAGEYYNNKTDWLLADRVTVVASQTTTLIDFTLSGGGSISGTVTDGTNPVANADVWAETYDCCGGNGARTDTSGNYTISGLAAGNYRVQVFVQGQNLSSEYYDNQTDWWLADTVIVTESVTTANINFILSSGGSISGLVTDGTNPIANVEVWAESYDCCAGGNGTQTASDGTYTISGLAPGDYRVQIFINGGNFSGEFYNDTRDWFLADRVTVAADLTTPNIDFILDAGGSISGNVKDSLGNAIPNADVWAETYDCCGGNGTRTDASGNYTISGLATGNYRVQVNVFGADYTGEFYNGTTDWALAAQVAVTAGQTTTLIDFTLGAGGSISGKVTDGTNPVAGADIWANSFDCCGGNGTRTKSDGTYTINGLAPGNYRIQVYVGNADLAGEFYNDKPDWDTADAVVVTAGQTTTLVDIVLASGGSISGTIKDSGNFAIANADVWASSYNGSGGFGWGRSFSDGTYTISGLLPGTYRVEVSAEGKIHTLYDGTSSWESATPVTVLSGQTTLSIDFTLGNGGTVTGTVRDGNGVAVANAEVNASSYDGAGGWGWTQTAADGTFVIDGLATGDYRVQAGAPQLGMTYEFYNETSDWNSATRVAVTDGNTEANIDFTLGGGGTVTGKVTDSVGVAVANAWVWADLYDCCGGNGASTASDGTYSIPGLAPGDYRVQVFAEDKGLVGEFYNDTSDWSLAARVTVAEGLTTANIDFSLGGGGSLSGTVTDAIGNPVVNAWIWADLYDCCGGNGTATELDGTYKIVGLAPGNYRVQVMAQEQGLTSEFYNGTSNWDLATSVAVVSGQDTPLINFSLSAGGSISGNVTDGTNPIANVWVWADSYDCCGGGNGGETDANGNYTISGLPTGDFRVQVWAMDLGLVGQFYNNTGDWELAERVNVTAGVDHSGINFTLGAGGSLSGTVRDGDGNPVANVSIWAETFECCSGGNGSMTEADGTYKVEGLAPGDYRVQVFAQELGFAVGYYNGVTDWESANPVTVASGADTPNIDFALAAGGSISGKVIADSDGLGVAGAWVWAESLVCCSGNEVPTNPDGTYTIFGLVPGQYIVSVNAAEHGLAGEFYNNTLDWTLATPVTVVSGVDAPNIDFSLGGGGTIIGKVTEADGVTPIPGAFVFAEPDWEGAVEVEVMTGADGTYKMIGLSPGAYIVEAAANGFALEIYNETNDFELAQIVEVFSDGITANVNFTLDVGGTISGTVTNGSTPIAFTEIVAWPTTKPFVPGEFTFGGEALFDGTYEVFGLPAGDYYVFAVGTQEGYAFEFYGDTPDITLATTVTVVAGQDTPSIDFVLALGGSISGTVVMQSDGVTPVPVMGVMAIEAGSGIMMGMTETTFDGSYDLVGLPGGSYVVFTEDFLGLGYIREYYNNVALEGSATPVVVIAEQNTLGINFTLDMDINGPF